MSERDTTIDRRTVLKGLSGTAAAGAVGVSAAGTATAAEAGEPVALQYFHEDWQTITNDLDRVADEVFDAIWIQAPQKSRLDYDHPIYEGRGDPPMGYQPIDLRVFDSVMGTEEELRTLIDTAHDEGVDVYIDTIMNHMAAGQEPKYEFPQFSSWDFHHDSDPTEKTREIYGMPDLKQEKEYVRGELYDYMAKIADVGADGYRLDAAKNMPQWFFRDYANPWAEDDFGGMFRVGEVFDDRVSMLQEYANTGMYCFDYPLFFVIEEVFTSGGYWSDSGDMRRLEGAGLVAQDPDHAMPFVENHDTQSPEQYMLAHAFVMTVGGYPMLYNLYPGEILSDGAIADMVWVKKNLAGGETAWLHTDSDLAVYRRGENLLVGLNNSTSSQSQTVQTPWANAELQDHAGNASNVTTDSRGEVQLSVPSESWTFYAPVDGGGGGDPDRYCGTAANSQHVDAGRAYASWSWYYWTYLYYAEGSDEYIGYQGDAQTTLSEDSDGYFVPTDSC